MIASKTLARNPWEVPVEYVMQMERNKVVFCHSSACFQGAPCGTKCPALQRNLRGCRMIMEWDLYEDFFPGEEDIGKKCVANGLRAYSWQLSAGCLNLDCSAF